MTMAKKTAEEMQDEINESEVELYMQELDTNLQDATSCETTEDVIANLDAAKESAQALVLELTMLLGSVRK